MPEGLAHQRPQPIPGRQIDLRTIALPVIDACIAAFMDILDNNRGACRKTGETQSNETRQARMTGFIPRLPPQRASRNEL